MARAIWTGTVSFGLVSIPVRLYNATAQKDVRFHLFDRQSGQRVRYRRVTESDAEWEPPEAFTEGRREGLEAEEVESADDRRSELGLEPTGPVGAPTQAGQGSSRDEPVVAYEDVVKGFEVDRDRFVMVSPEELEALRPEQSRTIEIEHFVDLGDIDPVYFEKSYYLAPGRGVGAEKPYGLLLAAMERAGKVGVGRFVLRSKEYLAAIRPIRGMLGLETMFYDDEVRTADEIDNVPGAVLGEPSSRELDVAVRLIELLATDWDPARYQDAYRQRVLDLIEGKLETEQVHVPEPGPAPSAASGVPDLMAALKASVEAARSRTTAGSTDKRAGASAKGRGRKTG
jgi:DNA end-binding protein Ku